MRLALAHPCCAERGGTLLWLRLLPCAVAAIARASRQCASTTEMPCKTNESPQQQGDRTMSRIRSASSSTRICETGVGEQGW